MLRLSDAFPEGADADVEVRVRMLNINYGRNPKLLDACQPLKEYSWLMNRIRDNIRENKKAGIDKDQVVIKAVDQAIEEMPMDYIILKLFLEVHRAEVKGMLLTEYNEAEAMKLFELDGERRGERRGIKKGENNMADLMQRLFAEGRVEDARRAASDQAFRNHLFKEYSIM